jgi:hypothetical protein
VTRWRSLSPTARMSITFHQRSGTVMLPLAMV